MMKKNNQIYNEDDSIDLIELLSTIWKEKFFIIKSTLIFTLIGIIYSLSLKNNFTATSVFYPHYQSNDISQGQGFRNLAGLAGLAGIDLGGTQTSDNVPPNLYPNIINSPQFKIKILDSKINLEAEELSYRDYLQRLNNQLYFEKLFLLPIKKISELLIENNVKLTNKVDDILSLTDEEYKLHKKLSDIIQLELNEKEGFIELSVRDNNPLIASQIAIKANNILQENIIDFKLKNLNDTYKFVTSQLEFAKINFYNLQDSLAVFSDKNKNIKSDLFLNQYSRIESEYLISKNIYNELALNKEKTAIEVKKNTPIFTIIKPVVIPNEKSDPKRSLIVIICSFIGLVITSGYILLKHSIFEIWKKINNK